MRIVRLPGIHHDSNVILAIGTLGNIMIDSGTSWYQSLQLERVFVEDLRQFLEINTGEEFYLLRNESRGKGIGFFEAGNFYPDFLLWKIKGDTQYIAFIEPHGLLHEGPGHKKIEFHKTIKNIQQRLSSENVCLNSFIVTPTKYAKLNWGLGIEELEEMNVLFMQDAQDSYISSVMTRMEQ